MRILRSPWMGAAAATAFFAVTAGPLILGVGWAVLWSGASVGEALGLAVEGWRAGHAWLLIWAGAALAASAAIWTSARVFVSTLSAERQANRPTGTVPPAAG